MKLFLVEGKEERVALQKEFSANLGDVWQKHEEKEVTYHRGTETFPVFHDGKYFFASRHLSDKEEKVRTSRFWNHYGEYRERRLQSELQINIPTNQNPDNNVAGFFARNEKGAVYLMHSGRINGRKMDDFLNWLEIKGHKLEGAMDSSGENRRGAIVTRVDSEDIGEKISNFIQAAVDFKKSDPEKVRAHIKKQKKLQNQPQESAGQKCRPYSWGYAGEIETSGNRRGAHETHHNVVVHALYQWKLETVKENQCVIDPVDLGVMKKERLTEVYEVKTKCDTQSLYTAIGQIFVYSNDGAADCARYLVVPENSIAPKIQSALDNHNIEVIRYGCKKNKNGYYVTLFDAAKECLWRGDVRPPK